MTASDIKLSNVAQNVSTVPLGPKAKGIVAPELLTHENTGEATTDKKHKVEDRDSYYQIFVNSEFTRLLSDAIVEEFHPANFLEILGSKRG